MKKLSITVFTVICALCMAFAVSLMTNTNKANAETVDGVTPVLSETKYKISTDKNGMLIATGIKNYDDVYEVGYTFSGDVTAVNNSTTKYYTSITSGTNEWTVEELFEGYTGMIVWEVEYNPAVEYSYKAYAKVGDRVDGNLVETDKKVEGTTKTATVETYTVSIASNNNEYGTVSAASVANVPYGTAITVDGNVITIGETVITATAASATVANTYAFTNFTGYTATVTGDTNITANFTQAVRKYTITFEMGDGTAIDPIQEDYGTPVSGLNGISVTPPTGYHFVKWQLKTGESTYVDFEGTETLGQDITVKAIYEINTYTITWYDEDGETVLETDTGVEYGATPSFDGATPTKADSYAYTYAFDGWTPAVATVTGNVSYTATYAGTLIPRTSFDFEDAGDLQYVTMSGMTNMERVANDGTFAPVHENSGNYILKGTPTDGNATFTFNFGQTLAAGTQLKFSMYVANEDNNVYGWFPLIVNGLNQLSNFAYWTSGTQWNKDSWAEGPWTLQSDASSLSICCNFAGFRSNGGNALDISKLTVYIDNIVVILPKTSFDFESASDLQYVTMSGMTNMERVANDGTFAPIHDGSGNYLLKGTPTDENATFTFNFGQTLAAGTKLHFSIYVANEDDNVYGWFPLIVNGLNQGASYAYWTSGTQWSKDSWAEGPWTLQSDSSSLSICCNFAGFNAYAGSNALDISKLTVYIDNVIVVS